MKKLFFSLILITSSLIIFSQTYDVTISGIVTDNITGNPVVNQEININTDTLLPGGGGFTYYNTVITDNSGFYIDTLLVPTGAQGIVNVGTTSCGTYLYQYGTFSPNATQFEFDFQVCGDSTWGCQAMFYYYPTPDSLGIQFIDESLGNPDTWMWEFGDGNNSSDQNPIHNYPEPGEYLTSLTISGQGCTSTTEMLVFVIGDTLPPGGCQAMFYYYQNNLPNAVQFIDDSYGYPSSWTWDFGDGITSNQQNPEHIYSEPGEYLVSLLIEGDSNQCFSSYEEIVYVGDSIWPSDCQAMFFTYPDSNDFMAINFVDMSIAGGNNGGTSGIPETWYWEFGDGNSSSEQNPVHTYSSIEGEYQVCLTITDSSGSCESTHCDLVFVGNWTPECEAYFWYYPIEDTNNWGGNWDNQNIGFIDASMGNPDTWYWDFGDGATSTEQNPIHYFSNEGVYNVCLSISNTLDSCESTFCQEVYIYTDTTTGCYTWYDYQVNDLVVDFNAYLEGGSNNVDYNWIFGDGTSGSGANVTHTFSESGIYEVLLSSSDSLGCYSEYIETIWVGNAFTFNIDGYVHLQDSMYADYADVHLMTFDTLNYGLTNVGTTQINEYGYYSFESVGVENCIYYVQAELTSTSAFFGSYVPTYHLDAINWEVAWPVFPVPTGWSYDIFMAPVSSSSTGSGTISGTVVTLSTREVMDNVEILLLDNQGLPITYLRTNEDGIFSFDNLANGTYTVYAEITGIETIPFDITISDQNHEASVNIVVNNGQAVLSIDDIESSYIETVDNIYPNPVSQNASVNIEVKESSNIKIEILNQFGQSMYLKDYKLINGKHKVIIPSESLAAGYYFVKITSADNVSIVRKFVKLR